MVGGIFATVVIAFVVFGFSDARPSATAAISLTLLGVVWVGGGLAAFMLLREIPENGRLVVFTVLIAVFADDTAAYFVGRTIGRHKMAPTISPGKSWEGFIGGTIAAMAVAFFAMYDQGFLTDLEAARARRGDRGVVDARRPVRVGDQARPRREGLGAASRRARRRARPHRFHPLGRPGRLLRRARADVTPSCQAPCTHEARRPPRCNRLDRRSGDRHRRAKPRARALRADVRHRSRSPSSRRLTASSTSRSAAPPPRFCAPASPTSSSTPSSASPAWRRRSGRSSAASRLRSRTRRASSRPASSRSRAHRRGGGLLLPVDSEHSAIFQCLEGRDRDDGRVARPHRLGRPVPRPLARGARARHDRRRRWHIQPGRWDERSLWTPRPSPTRGSS